MARLSRLLASSMTCVIYDKSQHHVHSLHLSHSLVSITQYFENEIHSLRYFKFLLYLMQQVYFSVGVKHWLPADTHNHSATVVFVSFHQFHFYQGKVNHKKFRTSNWLSLQHIFESKTIFQVSDNNVQIPHRITQWAAQQVGKQDSYSCDSFTALPLLPPVQTRKCSQLYLSYIWQWAFQLEYCKLQQTEVESASIKYRRPL
jgi:hypothetical protein